MTRGIAAVSLTAVLVAAVSTLVACGSEPAPPAAPPVPAGCERYLTVAEVERAMGRPVREVVSENGEDCVFRLGTPQDGAALGIIVETAAHAADVPGLRQIDLDALPPHSEQQISSYYEVADGRETLLALSGAAFYELITDSHPTGDGTALTGVRPQLVGLAKTVATRL